MNLDAKFSARAPKFGPGWRRALTVLLVGLCASAGAGAADRRAVTIDLGSGVEMSFVWIPPGQFIMGAATEQADEAPVRTVTISEGFWMGATEVTQAQWRQLMSDDPSHFAATHARWKM